MVDHSHPFRAARGVSRGTVRPTLGDGQPVSARQVTGPATPSTTRRLTLW